MQDYDDLFGAEGPLARSLPGFTPRHAQMQMAGRVAEALATRGTLIVEAGTGTGKSLAYLVPSIARAVTGDSPVVVSTATIALQRQLVDRDLPRLADALVDELPRRPRFAVLKGRRNYLCLNKIHSGAAGDEAVDAFLAAGFTKAQVFEVVTVIATKTISNYVNHLAHTPKESFMADPTLGWTAPRNR